MMLGAKDAIFIVGMGRSGTSAATRVLSLCGAALPRDVLPPNSGNPTGYWEPLRALELNNVFLERHGSSWYDQTLRLQTAPISPADASDFVARIAQCISGAFDRGDPIILKEPRISGLLPYWRAAARALSLNVKIVHIFRDPEEVADSLETRDALPREHSHALWLKYNLIAERDARGLSRIFVSYDELLKNWEHVVRRCIDHLKLNLSIDDTIRGRVADFLSPRLRHHQRGADQGREDVAAGEWLRRTRVLLEQARTASANEHAFDLVREDYTRHITGAEPPFMAAIGVAR